MATSVRLRLEFRNRTGLELWIVERDGKAFLWIDVQIHAPPKPSTWSTRNPQGEPVEGTFTVEAWRDDPAARAQVFRDILQTVQGLEVEITDMG